MSPDELAAAARVSLLGSIPLTEALPEAAQPLGDDYLLLEQIGSGGMGEVWKARQVSTRRDVAVKLLRHGLPGDRFTREVEALGKLEHSGIVRLYHAGTHTDGRPFLVMELVEGTTLAQKLQAGPLNPRTSAQTASQVAEALQYVAEKGLVHRDIKPSNILLDRLGQVRVTDFGLVKDLQVDAKLTLTQDQLGTPAYMAPEQVDRSRGSVTPLTDIYGVGALLYHALTGRPPFAGETTAQILHQASSVEPDWKGAWSGIHRDLKMITRKAMAKEPGQRYPSAAELAADLGRFLRGEPIHAKPPSFLTTAWRKGRQPLPVAMLLLTVLFAVIWGLYAPKSLRSEVSAVLKSWPTPPPTIRNTLGMAPRAGGFIAFSPDGKMVSTGGYSNHVTTATIDPWEVIVPSYHKSRAYSIMEWHPNSKQLFLGETNGQCWMWRPQRPPVLVFAGQQTASATAVTFSKDGSKVVVGAQDGRIRGWVELGFTKYATYFEAQQPGAIILQRFLNDPDHLLVVSSDGTIRDWNTASKTFTTPSVPFQEILALDVDAGGKYLALACRANQSNRSIIHLIRLRDLTLLQSLPWKSVINHLQFSPDGGRVAMASVADPIRVFDLQLRTVLWTSAQPGSCRRVCFSPDSLRLMSVDLGGTVRVWDAHTAEPLTQPWRSTFLIVNAVFSPDGVLAGCAEASRVATIWDVGCPLPRNWDRPALSAALKADGRVEALRRAVWLDPSDREALRLLSEATGRTARTDWERSEAAFLKRRAVSMAAPK